jgi:putative ABC transport system substrate-binding protein
LNRGLIVEFAAPIRLSAICAFKEDSVGGGMAAYGVDVIDLFRPVVGYADKILREANPGELPVEQPANFHISNHTMAGLLGLAVPALVLARADEVLE